MGCRKSKPQEEKPSPELKLDKLENNGIPKVDPRLPLDARQVFKLKQSWKGIKRNIEETGMEMFVRLFKSTPYMIGIFKEFNSLKTEDEMRANESLEQHATFVMTTLDETISNIDNYDFVKDLSHRTGGSHQRFTEFQADNFKKIKQPFLEAVKITLGDRYTDYMANVYTVTIDFILDSLVEGFVDNSSYQGKLTIENEAKNNGGEVKESNS